VEGYEAETVNMVKDLKDDVMASLQLETVRCLRQRP